MLVFTVKQLIDMSVGSTPDAFAGTVKSIRTPLRSKPEAPEPWKMQKLVITDEGADIEVVLDNREEDIPTSVVGQRLYVTAGKHSKTGASCGVKRKEYQGKPQISVYDSAGISFEAPSNGQRTQAPAAAPAQSRQPASPPTQSRQTPAAQAPANAQTPESKASTRDAEMKSFNKRVGRTSAALNRCFDAAIKLTQDVNARHAGVLGKPSAELIEKIAMGLMVNACWTQKPADTPDFPTNLFQSYEKPASEPAPAGAPFTA